MRHLMFAITTVVIGLVLGAIAALTTLLLDWLLSLPPFETVAGWTLLGLTLPVLLGFLMFALLLAFIIGWLYVALEERPQPNIANETQREINKASDGMERLQPIRVSEDGRHAFLALHLEHTDWNPSNPFYCQSVMSSTPGVWQTGSYYYLVVRHEQGRITPIAMPGGYGNELEIQILMRTVGLDRINHAFWCGLHATLSGADIPIPFLKLISTSICNGFIGWSTSRLHERFKHYAQEALFPHLTQNGGALLVEPPKDLSFDAVRCSFTVPSSTTLHFRQNLRTVPVGEIKRVIQALENDFYPFAVKHTARLALPLETAA